MIREELLEELDLGRRSMAGLLRKLREEDWAWRPAENMRSVRELAEHTAAIFEVDLHIWQEHDHATIQKIEKRYAELATADELIDAMNEGFETYESYMLGLTDEEFLTKKTTPFYAEEGQTQLHWLVEEVSHFFHHRGQFFTYLKQRGYDISMFDLYV
ncbi:DinB family protein [Paenalkalicoccus suaedae]|uniref:DinB family protein n=1 Tax=Paenalkalicoccus suaedae TaxID=2592382 RepID=A0A859FAE0_9BACI|nr:DinB family protein [Paenalkalicoccus suaedae]QKS69897.1 DinB family protein [Paenalkalicoccus suaedae]